MESPAYWGHAERVIQAVLEEDERKEKEMCGWSLAMRISIALEKAGLLIPEDRHQHNHFTRDIQPDTCHICATYI